jgi:hypothetical protein
VVEELADDSLAELDPLMMARELEAIRKELIDRRLFSATGRLELRTATPPPLVEKSAEVARADTPSASTIARRGGSSPGSARRLAVTDDRESHHP